jgi:aminocarboxymuconate-semialdehyde decarboxylase
MADRPRLIDIHCHVVPRSLPDDPTGGQITAWPSIHCEACAREAMVKVGGRPFREIDDRSWDPAARIADMDAEGIDVQVISPMPELLAYWIDAPAAVELNRRCNDAIAEMTAARSDRFHGLGAVPLQDPDLAAREIADLKGRFGLRGLEFGSNVAGVYLGDPRFDPVFAAAQENDLSIFVHALHPLSAKNLAAWPMVVPFAGFPADTALCAATMIMAGIIDRFPRLRIAFSHGGGALGPLIHRMEYGWGATQGFGGKVASSPRVQARRFFYDSLVYDHAYLRHLAADIAPRQICLGTDYPYLIQQPAPRAFIETAAALPGVDDSIFSDAAERFLGLKP